MVSLLQLMAARSAYNHGSVPSTTFADYISALSPVAWWRMDDAVGSTVLTDSVAGAIATLQGTYTLGVPGLVTGDSDTAVQLYGASCAYTSAASKWTLGTGDYSAIILAKWTGSIYSTIAACRDLTQYGTLFTMAMNRTSGSIEVQAQGGSTGRCETVGTSYNDGNVHVIGLTQQASTGILTLYVDGAFKKNVTQGASRPTATDMNVTIGANIGKNQNFVGTADEFAMFNFALSSTQMADISNLVHSGHL